MKQKMRVALYCRLSQEDKKCDRESSSIANQKKILTEYVLKQDWVVAELYIDDGFSGTNYERPAFKKMLDDIPSRNFTCIVTKDLSRLGRNYSETGYYIDNFFPMKGIRYIALNDNVDTQGKENDYVGFTNVINEFFPRDVSKKVRQVKRYNAEQGNFMGSQAPYGYMKSPEDKHKLLIDEKTVEVVRYIFNSYAQKMNGREIADVLNAKHIPTPSMILNERTHKKYKESPYWSSSSIYNIITNQVYIGNMVQGKRTTVSFKSKKRRNIDKEDWIVVPNTHEAIISKIVWEEVQKNQSTKTCHHRSLSPDKELATFSGLLKCADCDSPLSASLRGQTKTPTYRCNNYVNKGKHACSSHNIQQRVLEDIVCQDIQHYAKLVKLDYEVITNQILERLIAHDKSIVKNNIKKKKGLQTELDSIFAIIKSLYCDKTLGKIPEDIFYSLLSEYKADKDKLEQQLFELGKSISDDTSKQEKINGWIKEIKNYSALKTINRSVAVRLIEKIVVGSIVTENDNKSQNITIYYKIVGNLDALLHNEKEALLESSAS